MARITCDLNKQLQASLDNSFFSDSMIVDRLLQFQRSEVEDQLEGLDNMGCDEVILKGVTLTKVPNVANPMAHVLESLTNKLDVAREDFDVDNKSAHIDSSRDVSGIRESAKAKRSHKVLVGDKLLNEYEENPELIGGAFAILFPWQRRTINPQVGANMANVS